jgi:hypothetical protein
MKRVSSLFAVVVISIVAFSTIAMSAPKAEHGNKRFLLEGKVIHINRQQRTMLVEEQYSDKLYLVKVPDGRTFKITFGLFMNLAEAGFRDVRLNDNIRVECKRTSTEHLARLEDGRQAIELVATR